MHNSTHAASPGPTSRISYKIRNAVGAQGLQNFLLGLGECHGLLFLFATQNWISYFDYIWVQEWIRCNIAAVGPHVFSCNSGAKPQHVQSVPQRLAARDWAGKSCDLACALCLLLVVGYVTSLKNPRPRISSPKPLRNRDVRPLVS